MAFNSQCTNSHITSALPIATLQLYYMNIGHTERKDVRELLPMFHANSQDATIDSESKLARKESIVRRIKKRIFRKSKKGRSEPAGRPTTVIYSPLDLRSSTNATAQSSSGSKTRLASDISTEASMTKADETAEATRIPVVVDHPAVDSLFSLEALASHTGHEETTVTPQQATEVVFSAQFPESVLEPSTPPFALAEHANSVIRALKSTATEDGASTHSETVLEPPEGLAFLPFRLFDDDTVASSPNLSFTTILHDKDDVAEQPALNPPTTDEDDALLDVTLSIEEEFFSAVEHFEKGDLFNYAPSKEDSSKSISKREEVSKLTPGCVSPICKPIVVAVASLGVLAMFVPIMSRLLRR